MKRAQLLELIEMLFTSEPRFVFSYGGGRMIFDMPVGKGQKISLVELARMGERGLWRSSEGGVSSEVSAQITLDTQELLECSKPFLRHAQTEQGKDRIAFIIVNNESLRQLYIFIMKYWEYIISQIRSGELAVGSKFNVMKYQDIDSIVRLLIAKEQLLYDPRYMPDRPVPGFHTGCVLWELDEKCDSGSILRRIDEEVHQLLSTGSDREILEYLTECIGQARDSLNDFDKMHRDALELVTKDKAPDQKDWDDDPVLQKYLESITASFYRIEGNTDRKGEKSFNKLPPVNAFEQAVKGGYLSQQDSEGHYRAIKQLAQAFETYPSLIALKPETLGEYLRKPNGKPYNKDTIRGYVSRNKS